MINLALHLVLEKINAFSFCRDDPIVCKENKGLKVVLMTDRKAGQELWGRPAPGTGFPAVKYVGALFR